jgi:lysozyme family protein
MTYEQALAFVLRWEGGYSNHPNDPGGATNKGVTQKTYDSYLALHGQASADVRRITDQEIANIYSVHYWAAAHCSQLPADLAPCVFNCAVNSGVSRAVKLLQRTLGVAEDGIVGPKTLGAWQPAGGPRDLDVADAVFMNNFFYKTYLKFLGYFFLFLQFYCYFY